MKGKTPKITTDSKFFTGIVISEDCESVMLGGYNKKGELVPVAFGKSEIGIAMGDMVDFDFSGMTTLLKDIKDFIKTGYEPKKIIEYIYKILYTDCSYNGNNNIFDKNLYLMPLYAEFLNLAVDYQEGKTPHFRDAELKINYCMKIANQFRYLCENALNPDQKKDPLQFYLSDDNYNSPSTDYTGKTILYDLKFDDYKAVCELFFPETIEDFFGYCACKNLTTNKKFIKCHYCGKYFAYTTNGKTKYCSRMVFDKDLPCNEVGRSLRYTEDIKSSEAKTTYRKYYRKVNYHVNAGNLDRSTFDVWAVKARKLRDKTEGGKMTLEEFEDWLKTHLPI